MCTTEAEKPRVIEAVKAGVDNYIVKPFTPGVLQEKLEETFARSGLTMPV
jgi:two-component system chemotaxis response regulator CheY